MTFSGLELLDDAETRDGDQEFVAPSVLDDHDFDGLGAAAVETVQRAETERLVFKPQVLPDSVIYVDDVVPRVQLAEVLEKALLLSFARSLGAPLPDSCSKDLLLGHVSEAFAPQDKAILQLSECHRVEDIGVDTIASQ